MLQRTASDELEDTRVYSYNHHNSGAHVVGTDVTSTDYFLQPPLYPTQACLPPAFHHHNGAGGLTLLTPDADAALMDFSAPAPSVHFDQQEEEEEEEHHTSLLGEEEEEEEDDSVPDSPVLPVAQPHHHQLPLVYSTSTSSSSSSSSVSSPSTSSSSCAWELAECTIDATHVEYSVLFKAAKKNTNKYEARVDPELYTKGYWWDLWVRIRGVPNCGLEARVSLITEDGEPVINNNAKHQYAPMRGQLTCPLVDVPGAPGVLEARVRVQLQTTSYMNRKKNFRFCIAICVPDPQPIHVLALLSNAFECRAKKIPPSRQRPSAAATTTTSASSSAASTSSAPLIPPRRKRLSSQANDNDDDEDDDYEDSDGDYVPEEEEVVMSIDDSAACVEEEEEEEAGSSSAAGLFSVSDQRRVQPPRRKRARTQQPSMEELNELVRTLDHSRIQFLCNLLLQQRPAA